MKSALLHDMPEAALAGAEWERAGLTLTEAFPEILPGLLAALPHSLSLARDKVLT